MSWGLVLAFSGVWAIGIAAWIAPFWLERERRKDRERQEQAK